MKKIVFLFSIIVFLYSCNSGKIEKREKCDDMDNCYKLYLVNTSKTKAYKFILNWKSKVININYPYDYEYGDMNESDKRLFDTKINEKRFKENIGTDKIFLLPGESKTLGEEIFKESLVLKTKPGYWSTGGFSREQLSKAFNVPIESIPENKPTWNPDEDIIYYDVFTYKVEYEIVGYLETTDK